jgi:hypothetical protein
VAKLTSSVTIAGIVIKIFFIVIITMSPMRNGQAVKSFSVISDGDSEVFVKAKAKLTEECKKAAVGGSVKAIYPMFCNDVWG